MLGWEYVLLQTVGETHCTAAAEEKRGTGADTAAVEDGSLLALGRLTTDP